jgi:Tfp pilus assembly protein PilO
MSTRRIWIAGCVLVMVASVALGWLLGASPLLAVATADGQAREAAQTQNAIYIEELAALKTQFEGLDQLEDDLEALREELPAQADQPEYLEQLASAAQRHNVQLTSITAADALAYAPTAAEIPAAEVPTAEAPAADAEAAAAAAEPVAAPAGAGVPVTSPLVTAENFISIPMTLAVEGSYGNVLDFVESVQKGTRLSAVTAFSTSTDAAGGGAEAGDAEGAEAPAGADTVTGTVTMFIYVLVDPAAE